MDEGSRPHAWSNLGWIKGLDPLHALSHLDGHKVVPRDKDVAPLSRDCVKGGLVGGLGGVQLVNLMIVAGGERMIRRERWERKQEAFKGGQSRTENTALLLIA